MDNGCLNKIRVTLCVLFCLFLGSAYTFPDNTYYARVDCTLGNNFIIRFPYSNNMLFDVTDDSIINVSSSTVYGYYGTDSRINFPTFDKPYYSQSYNNPVLINITKVYEHNLPVFGKTQTIKDNALLIICITGLLMFILGVFKR